jgi:uncharacterized protein
VRILAVADAEHPSLYDFFDRERWRGVELVLGCGDLDGDYLDFLATSLGVPLFYVRGNHDRNLWKNDKPAGDDIGFRVVTYKGVRLAGFEGCAWYGGRGIEYTEWQMRWRVWNLIPRLMLHRGVDLIVSHAPPSLRPEEVEVLESPSLLLDTSAQATGKASTPEMELGDRAHRGFTSYTDLLSLFPPRVWLHGHVHLNYGRLPRVRRFRQTIIANAYGYLLLDV